MSGVGLSMSSALRAAMGPEEYDRLRKMRFESLYGVPVAAMSRQDLLVVVAWTLENRAVLDLYPQASGEAQL